MLAIGSLFPLFFRALSKAHFPGRSAGISRYSLIAGIALLVFCPRLALAQPPTDSLNGKTIHLYVQSDDFNNFWFQNGDVPFKLDSKYNYSLTLSGRDLYQQDFFLSSNGTRDIGEHYKWKLTKVGISENEGARFTVADFKGQKEIWIVIDPAGAITAPPLILYSAPRVVNILNPWETTAPKLIAGTKTIKMSTTPGRCGWFQALLLDTTLTKFHFAEVNNAPDATYGKGGFGATDDFDLAPIFTASGPVQWLNTESNVWTAVWPSVDGNCQYLMAATVRDFSMAHPDFEYGDVIKGDLMMPGAVENIIGADRHPVRSSKTGTINNVNLFNDFNSWWKTDTTNSVQGLRSYESCVDIPMSKSSDGLWEYDSYRDSPTDHSFFPLEPLATSSPAEYNRHGDVLPASCYVKPPPDSTNWVQGGPKRNGNFCMESHATFIYQRGQEFAFRGDDDVWVFINDKLVVDLGGIHTPKSQTVKLDNQGLTEGSEYKWDFFYCDRQKCGSSLRVKTSIYFKQKRSLDTTKTVSGETTSFKIFKREGGKGSCASAGTEEKIVDPVNLKYQLINVNGQLVEELAVGNFHVGITITTTSVTVKENDIRDLAPGKYRIAAFEAANEGVKVYIPFTVPSRNFIELDPVRPPTGYTLDTLVSALVPVVAANRELGVLVDSAQKYTLTISAGAKVFSDKAGTVPVTEATELMTNSNGLDTVWVTGNPAGPDNQVVTLQTKNSAKKVTITFHLPPPIIVELEPPYTVGVPITAVVPIIASTYQQGLPLAAATPYILNFNSPQGQVFSDAALTMPVAAGGALTTDATGNDTLWVKADTASFVNQVVTLQTGNSTKQIVITFQLPPLIFPQAISAGVYDVNGDGIGDSLAVAYDSNMRVTTPKSIAFAWPQSGAAQSLANTQIIPLLDVTGKNLGLGGLAFSATPLTSGNGTLTTTFFARGKDSSLTTPLSDKIAPIILKAEARQGVTGDTLLITFSEPINAVGMQAPNSNLFEYAINPTDTTVSLPPTHIGWTDGSTVAVLTYAAGVLSPQPGQKVRIAINPAGIVDAAGNTVGPVSRYRIISGVKRVDLKTITLKEGPAGTELYQEPSIKLIRVDLAETVESVSNKTGRLGHLIKIDLGDFAVSDDFNAVDPKDVRLKWSVAYFDNTGSFVTKAGGELKCTDELFHGDCTLTANRGNIFIGWNFTTQQGGMVGTGAYISRLKFQAFAGATLVAANALDQRWGYIRHRQ